MPTLADQLLQEAGPKPPAVHASNEGAVVLLRHRFDAGEGEMGHPHQLRLGMAVGGGGRLQQHTLNGLLQASWRPGQFNLVLPADTGTYVSPSVDLIGIAIDTRMLPHNVQTLHHLQPLAARLHRDPVVSAVLTALWCSTQADACLPGFLEHGAQVLLHRLRQLAGQPREARGTTSALSARRLRQLEAYIDAQHGRALTVPQLAAAVQMEAATFSRALRAATGLPPYAFLTQRRMHWARTELAQGRRVTDVALANGYANPSKFSAAFRRVLGCSPSAWIAQSRTR
ncbi:helix-turn-helix transcriptional regulator [Stenotrophomonas maltophilia]|nr:AraC family transcriptional regulator [Stenotrophomonas maltophilia]MBA0241552.1 AraC family transcriptional regulator [Stenotrophomonas maltophilia]MBA0245858.1 AraC family transcriptional regulator [Stenotrophomonas maltophilia]MBA0305395.1 AraC family transcriptional regulator [Stenotrophomonas maltophilia]MBA0438119.1 AraC family transcriptional regulator [Stenotrophomonas maltophilia]